MYFGRLSKKEMKQNKSSNAVSRPITEKLGGVLISEEATLEQRIIDYGKEKGVLKEKDISYVCTYQILP